MASRTVSNIDTKVVVLREGTYMSFTPGDQLKDGDILLNNTDSSLRVSSVLNAGGGAYDQVLLKAGGSARVIRTGEDDVDLKALDGAIFQPTDDVIEADSADVVIHDENTLMGVVGGESDGGLGLLGAGLLAAGGIAAIAALSNDDNNGGTTVTETPTETGGPQTATPPPVVVETPVTPPEQPPTPTMEPTPQPPTDPDVAGVTGALLEVSEALNETPLAPLSAATDGLARATGAAGSAIQGAEASDPSGTLPPILSNTLGVGDPDFDASAVTGASGAAASISEGANSGIESGALAPLSEMLLRPALGQVVDGAAGFDEAAGTGGGGDTTPAPASDMGDLSLPAPLSTITDTLTSILPTDLGNIGT